MKNSFSQESNFSNVSIEEQPLITSESIISKSPIKIPQLADLIKQDKVKFTSLGDVYKPNVNSENSIPMTFIKNDDVFDVSRFNRNFMSEILRKKRTGYFDAAQKWEGRVDSIDIEKGIFTATVKDLTQKDVNDGTVEIDLVEVPEEDKELLKEGAIFYWNVGHYFTPEGPMISSSMIRFRRLPPISKKYLKNLPLVAKKYFNVSLSELKK